MACVLLSTPEEQIRQLREQIKKFTDFALAHQEFEAAMLNDDSPWFESMPEDVHVKMEEVQSLRNQALGF